MRNMKNQPLFKLNQDDASKKHLLLNIHPRAHFSKSQLDMHFESALTLSARWGFLDIVQQVAHLSSDDDIACALSHSMNNNHLEVVEYLIPLATQNVLKECITDILMSVDANGLLNKKSPSQIQQHTIVLCLSRLTDEYEAEHLLDPAMEFLLSSQSLVQKNKILEHVDTDRNTAVKRKI